MSKKKFAAPLVFLTAATNGTGGGYSQFEEQGIKPLPMSFEEWSVSRWCADYDQSGDVTIDDYARWWAQCGMSTDAWAEFNPSVVWKDEWSF